MQFAVPFLFLIPILKVTTLSNFEYLFWYFLVFLDIMLILYTSLYGVGVGGEMQRDSVSTYF